MTNHTMPKKQTTNAAPEALCLGQPRKGIRFFRKDEDEIAELHRRIGPVTGMSIVEIIRRCVRAGLPVVKRQLQPVRPGDAQSEILDGEGA